MTDGLTTRPLNMPRLSGNSSWLDGFLRPSGHIFSRLCGYPVTKAVRLWSKIQTVTSLVTGNERPGYDLLQHFSLACAALAGYHAGVIGWLGDFFRFWWGLLYWNSRKSLFRWRRDRARCPCQNPSDSGRAGETGCDALHDWRQPARFRRVCPLLVATPAGLRCSVDARDVRPFWRRAAAYYLGALAGIYLAVALGAFVLFRLIGYPVSPLTLAWPPRWPELRLARSEYFVTKAHRALDAHRVNEAILSLDLAFRNNPRNYEAGLQLAQLTSPGQPELADPVFALLMREHPDRRTTTSEAWFRFLLLHGRFARIADLASARLLEDAQQRPVWLHALFFATRQIGSDQPLRNLVSKPAAGLEPIYVALINSELLIRQGQGLQLLPGLTAELPAAAGFYGPYFQVSRLDALGRHAEALTVLNHYAKAKRIPEADEFRLRLDIMAGLGRQDLLRTRLEQAPINARELELVSIHLVRHPNPAVLAALAQCLQRSSLPSDATSYPAYTAFFVACGASGDWDQMHAAGIRLKEIAGSRMSRLEAIEGFFQQKPAAGIENILPMLPALSLDLIYSLFDRYDEVHPAVSIATTPPS